ncbi:MAG: S8 family serine peptidase [Thermoleophilia bacterium]
MGAVEAPPPARPAERPPARVAAVDPQLAVQGHLPQIHWTPPTGSRRPIVAVLDTGVDARSPDLAGVVMTDAARSFVPGSPDPLRDPAGHGTHVAGLIAADHDNGIGGAGVARARILPITIADAAGNTTTTALVRGLRYAAARGARVINISFGGAGSSKLEQDAIDDVTRRGALVVAAVGNSGPVGRVEYPAGYRQVLGVGAVDAADRPLALSLRGTQVAIAAPGDALLSTAPPGTPGALPGDLIARTGTSMAAAVVSGVAARLLAARPALSPARLRAVLVGTAVDVPPSGVDVATGAGAVDLAAALAAPAPPPEDPEPNDDPALARRRPALLGPSRAVRTVRGSTGSNADPRDDFRVSLRAGQTLTAVLAGEAGADLDLVAWRPGAPGRRRTPAYARTWLAAAAVGATASERLTFVAAETGAYTIEVSGIRGPSRYTLTVRRS